MKILNHIAIAALALIGAGKVVSLANAGVAVALVRFGHWDMAEAAHAAPWLLFAVVGGLSISLWCLHDINEDYKQSSPYGRIERDHARNAEWQEDQERGA